MNPHNQITTRLNSLAGIDKPKNRNTMKKIKSEVFTKISRVNLAFKDQITALRGDGKQT